MPTRPLEEIPIDHPPVLHHHTFRLSYADTDPAGILYYAAWFRRMEAVQSEFLFLEGLRQDRLKDERGWWTVTRATQCEYLVAVGLFDEIRLDLGLGRIGRSSFDFTHRMWRVVDDRLVARATITVVSVSPEGDAVRIPDELRARLESWAGA